MGPLGRAPWSLVALVAAMHPPGACSASCARAAAFVSARLPPIGAPGALGRRPAAPGRLGGLGLPLAHAPAPLRLGSRGVRGLRAAAEEAEADEETEERLERNRMIAEAYAGVVEEVTGGGKPMVEVALDVPARWWQEVVLPRLGRVADAGGLAPGKRALDVGTGPGTLVGALCGEGRAAEADVVGIDLCEGMLEAAQARYPAATFVEGDILDATLDDLQPQGEGGEGEGEAPPARKFDAVYFNAVFGSLPDQPAALAKAAELCARGGRVVVSHPMGADFVDSLHGDDPVFTPNPLPRAAALAELLRFLPLRMHGALVDDEEFYLATMERTAHSVMEEVLFMRGPVATGYGRGGKKLGVPTANLPESLFSDKLSAVPTGVYCGWASVGDSNTAVKAVVNVGYSPTFVGEENREKIAEAHLLSEFPEDFYGKEMRLILAGNQRPELKFGSFPELLAAIKQDIADADAALDTPELAPLAKHPFLRQDSGMVAWMAASYDMAKRAAEL